MTIILMEVFTVSMETGSLESQLISLITNILSKEKKKGAHAKIQSVLNSTANALREENTVVHIATAEIVKIIVKMNL